MKRILILFVIIGIGMGASSSLSQEKAPDKALTLEECIQLAIKNRPELEMSNLDILNAEYQIKEATSYYYPRLNLTAGYTHFNRPTEINVDVDISVIKKEVDKLRGLGVPIEIPGVLPQEFSIGKKDWFAVSVDLSQPIYTFGRIEEGVKQAGIGHSLAVKQKEKKRSEIVYEVKKGYSQLLFSREVLQLIKEAEARAAVVVKMVKIAYETAIPEKEGKGTTRLDYLKAKNFHSEIKAKLSEMDKNSKLAELALKIAMGLDSVSPLMIVEVPLESLPLAVGDLSEMKERTVERNLDLKSLELGVKLLDSRRRSAIKEYLPKIGIQGQYVGPEDRFESKNSWYAGIAITMPIFDGFLTKAKIGQAEIQFQKTKGQKLLLEKVLTVQVDHLNASLTELRERIEILQGAVKEAQERMNLASDGYAAGITEYDDLLLAQKSELEMRSAYLQSLFLYQTAKSEIELISGAL